MPTAHPLNSETGPPIRKILQETRKTLVDIGARNRFLHVNRANQRANCLNVINEQSDAIFAILRTNRKRMRFKPMGEDSASAGISLFAGSWNTQAPWCNGSSR
ncbi:MAG: DUF4011 domain-containing protein [Rhodobacteraceae bacterium]|nr:DUF4011 domain-containing protein [Paracoccaceae bacterium]